MTCNPPTSTTPRRSFAAAVSAASLKAALAKAQTAYSAANPGATSHPTAASADAARMLPGPKS